MKILRLLACLPLLLFTPLPALPAAAAVAAANTNSYQVEVVIFRSIAPPANEDLSKAAEGRGFEGSAASGVAPPTLVRKLDASQMQLGSLAARLRSSGAWQVLAHSGWIQTATDWPRHVGLDLADLGLTAPEPARQHLPGARPAVPALRRRPAPGRRARLVAERAAQGQIQREELLRPPGFRRHCDREPGAAQRSVTHLAAAAMQNGLSRADN